MNKKAGKTKRVKLISSLSKGLKIIDILTPVEKGFKLKDIARESGMAAPALIPYIRTLAACGWCYRDGRSKRYFLSQKKKDAFVNYSDDARSYIARAAEAPMQKLFKRFNENILLAVRRADRVVFFNKLESRRSSRIEVDQLPDYPLHATAAGRAILAFENPDYIREYLYGAKYELYTKYTIPNRAKLEVELDLTRERGYAFNNREFEDFIMAISAPIYMDSSPRASITMQLPESRYTASDCHKMAKYLRTCADRISDKLAKHKAI